MSDHIEFEKTVFPIEIKRSKGKTLFLFILAACFLALLVIFPFLKEMNGFTWAFIIFAYLFFGFGFLYTGLMLFDPRPGLVFIEEGFIDRTSAIATGFVPWANVEDIYVAQVYSQRFITVILKEPHVVMQKTKGIKKLFLQLNLRFYNSPVQINTNNLERSFQEIEKIFREQKKTYLHFHANR